MTPDTDRDEPSFDEFVAAQLPGLLRYAAALTGDRALAQDVVQDALVRAHHRWRRVLRADRPEAYVKRIVVNEYLSWRRRWHPRHVVLPATPLDETGLADQPVEPDHASRSADRADLRWRLAQLSPRQRAVLVLRYFEGLSDPEIAEILGCTQGTVRGYASRGLHALRLQPDPSDPARPAAKPIPRSHP
ncbi:MAG: SigE family RNA polymerase sigma factor [Mycobacteriales bacterium]